MRDLIQGIHRFRLEDFRTSYAVFQRRDTPDRPGPLVIACSDLGLDPLSVLSMKRDNYYVLQNMGNIVPPWNQGTGTISEIDAHLALYTITDIIVCGHMPCRVMRDLLAAEWDSGSFPATWFGHAARTRRILSDSYTAASKEELVDIAAAENVLVQLENLRTNPNVAQKLDNGSLYLHGWLFEDRKISAYVPQTHRFIPLIQ